MKIIFEKNKYSTTEVVLLGVFALGLLLSLILVISRNKIRLSSRKELGFTGVSVSVPVGPVWRSNENWQYDQQDKVFTLTATMYVQGKSEAMVQWRYLPRAERLAASERIKFYVTQGEVGVAKTGTIKWNQITLEWAQISQKSGTNDSFIGVAELADKRVLELKVLTAADEELARSIFEVVARSIDLVETSLLKEGIEFVKYLRDIGARELIRAEMGGKLQRAYVLRRQAAQLGTNDNVGFEVDIFSDSSDVYSNGIMSERLGYNIRNGAEWSNNSLFECDGRFEKFIWQNKHMNLKGRGGSNVAVELESDGELKICDLSSAEEQAFRPSEAAVAKVLIDSVTRAFVDYGSNELVIDVILANGAIVPMRLLKLPLEERPLDLPEVAHIVQLEYLDSKRGSQHVYFDGNKEIISKFEQRRIPLIWQRSDLDDVMEKFRPWEIYIQEMRDRYDPATMGV